MSTLLLHPFLKRVTVLKERICSLGSKLLPFKDLFSEGHNGQ